MLSSAQNHPANTRFKEVNAHKLRIAKKVKAPNATEKDEVPDARKLTKEKDWKAE
jgi:hypothetical protein